MWYSHPRLPGGQLDPSHHPRVVVSLQPDIMLYCNGYTTVKGACFPGPPRRPVGIRGLIVNGDEPEDCTGWVPYNRLACPVVGVPHHGDTNVGCS